MNQILYRAKAISFASVTIIVKELAKLESLDPWKFEVVDQIDISSPSLNTWLQGPSTKDVLDRIDQAGFVEITEGKLSTLLPELFGFFAKDTHEPISAYWGLMTKIGQLGSQCSAYFVQFHDDVPHNSHVHDAFGEIIFVVAGAIDQTINGETRRLSIGDSAIIPKGTEHFAKPLLPGTKVLVILFGDGTDYAVRALN